MKFHRQLVTFFQCRSQAVAWADWAIRAVNETTINVKVLTSLALSASSVSCETKSDRNLLPCFLPSPKLETARQ